MRAVLLLTVVSGCLIPTAEETVRHDAGSGGGSSEQLDAGFAGGAGGGVFAAGGPSAGGAAAVAGVTCASSGFCWDSVYGGVLRAVAGASPALVVAVGEGGVIATWRQGVVTWAASPTTKTLRGVWLQSEQLGWAVGDDGVLLEWDGATWRALPSGTTNDLTVIHGASGAVFAAGVEVVVRRGPNGVWASANATLPVQGSPAVVRSMVVASATDVDLVGAASADFLMHFDGVSWSEVEAPRGARGLFHLARCGNALFLSATAGPNETFVRRGGSWSRVVAPGARVACVSENDFVSFGSTPHLVNGRVTLEGSSTTLVAEQLFVEAAWVAGPREVFFVGLNGAFTRWNGNVLRETSSATRQLAGTFRLTTDGRVEQRLGGAWVSLTVPGAGVISDLSSPAEGQLWVVRGTEAHQLRDGQWGVPVALPTGTAHVRTHGSTAWFSGSATLAHWTGAALELEPIPVARSTGPVHVTATQTWVSTFSEAGIDVAWRKVSGSWRATTVSAWRIWGAGDEVYFTQVDSLSKWNGTSADVLRRSVETRALGVAADGLYVLDLEYTSQSYRHRLVKLDGAGRPTTLELGTTERLRAIEVAATGEVWLVTESGSLLRRPSGP